MTGLNEASRSKTGASRLGPGVRFWLWLSVPIAVLAITGSIIAIVLDDRIYAEETANWAAQAAGQDIANLIAYPALLLLALAASRGSVRAYLGWAGVLAYSVYSYAIYVFDIHFGPLFLVWVAVFGLSIYALIGGLASIDPTRVKASFTGRVAVRSTSVLLIGIGALFYLLWLSEILPATVAGTTPEAYAKAGVPTNPVHVLDLAVFLPAAVLAGTLVAKGHRWGYCLAPTVLVAMVFISVGIVSLMVVLAVRGQEAPLGVVAGVAVLAVVELVVVARFLGAIDGDRRLQDVLRPQRIAAQ
jgi:hypothetical protein